MYIPSDSTTILILVITVLLLYKWCRRKPQLCPPGPWGVPIIGVLPFLGKHYFKTFYEWSRVYGPVMSFKLFGVWIVLSDHKVIHEMLVKQGQHTSDKIKYRAREDVTKGDGILSRNYDEAYKVQRRFGLLTLRKFGMGKRCLESHISEEASMLIRLLVKENGNPFNFKVPMMAATSNVINQLAVGQRFDYDDVRLQAVLSELSQNVSTDSWHTKVLQYIRVAYFLRYIPPFSTVYHQFLKNAKDSFQIYQDFIDEHRFSFSPNSDSRDFIDEYLSQQGKHQQNSSFTNSQLLMYIRDLLMAGTDTTATFLTWCLLYLLHHQEAQARIHKEILDVFGSEGIVKYADKTKLPYTCAVIEEISRLCPIAPIIAHKTTNSTSVNGFSIPKGAVVVANLWAANHNWNKWDLPNDFIPERFLDNDGCFVPSQDLILFGVGPRSCLGEQLAKMEIFIFLSSLVQRFEFHPDPETNELPDLNCGSPGIIFAPPAFRVVAKLR